nr:MAG TPA: hypothetical protein [Caudoviricetes sp.]
MICRPLFAPLMRCNLYKCIYNKGVEIYPLISTKIEAYILRNKSALTDKFVIIRL